MNWILLAWPSHEPVDMVMRLLNIFNRISQQSFCKGSMIFFLTIWRQINFLWIHSRAPPRCIYWHAFQFLIMVMDMLLIIAIISVVEVEVMEDEVEAELIVVSLIVMGVIKQDYWTAQASRKTSLFAILVCFFRRSYIPNKLMHLHFGHLSHQRFQSLAKKIPFIT